MLFLNLLCLQETLQQKYSFNIYFLKNVLCHKPQWSLCTRVSLTWGLGRTKRPLETPDVPQQFHPNSLPQRSPLSPNQCPLQRDVRPEKQVGTLWPPNFNKNCQCHSAHLDQHPDPTHPQDLAPTRLEGTLSTWSIMQRFSLRRQTAMKTHYIFTCWTVKLFPTLHGVLEPCWGGGEGIGKDTDTITTR